MKRNLLLLLLAGMFTGLAQSQDAAKLDSTVLYNFVSVTDSARSLKEHYDVYTDDGQPVHVSQFRWKDGMWVYSGERSCTYDDAGTLLSREVITADHLGDRKVEYTYDGNGNVTTLVSTTDGAVSATYDYSPFGLTVSQSGPAADANTYRFSTKPRDETHLYYYGMRYYTPDLGRWINRDPIGEAGGMNTYKMADNQLCNSIDLNGYLPVSQTELFSYIFFQK